MRVDGLKAWTIRGCEGATGKASSGRCDRVSVECPEQVAITELAHPTQQGSATLARRVGKRSNGDRLEKDAEWR